ncbi:multisubstrate pseudouridine synthase 7 [Fusarium subglutinans]|uniref:Multisubstrate pseudouridine synthase 7 n=1 Tax=Gibberella subglutinans TaxID=42677 RepID=A0A8H5NZ25_GIBSU|nr:multisubstrate pseudouridine synthase 7 [Fusarium subglutinans]KAF5584781.1 multisubstrate pseudouridine synthase 7 [Fusarium subglutinans]
MAEQSHHAVRGTASYTRSIGISQRVTPLATPWTGEMRTRFSDFQVNEIKEDGTVLHLQQVGLAYEEATAIGGKKEFNGESTAQETKTDEPAKDALKQPSSETATRPESAPQPETVNDVSPEDAIILEGLTDQRFSQELIGVYRSGHGADHEKKKSVTSEPMDDRAKRGQVHQEIRRIFKSRIDTNTTDEGAIVATLIPPRKANSKKRGRGSRGGGREEKPAGEYLHFTLFKENRDTMDAVNQIARFLKVKPQVIGYAGTKDRRASTVQRCSVRYMRPRNLAGINGRIWGVSTGDYDYKDKPTYLGQLLGNEFVIAIKSCQIVGESNDQPIAQRVEVLKKNVDSALNHMNEHGWINYFGHQRFGTHEVGTHQIGQLILGDKYEEAVMSLLRYDDKIAQRAEAGDIPDEPSKRDECLRNQACMLFLTDKDVDRAINLMPRRFSAENSIFRHLNRQGAQSRRDFIGSLVHITRGLRSMYLHAYQSYIWNHAASRRWELHGKNVIAGDLIIAPTESVPLVSGQDQDGDDIINPVEDDEDAPVRARPLTAEEAASGNYTIFDIVLPTPGYDVVYPENDIGEFYKDFMGRDENGNLDPYKMRRMRREFSLPGRYRKIMNRFLATPSAEVRAYSDDAEQMHPTDLDNIKASKGPSRKRSHEDVDSGSTAKKTKVENGTHASTEVEMTSVQAETADDSSAPETAPAPQEPTKVAVVVKFQLGRSAYATIALRELMGDPTEDTETFTRDS